jgi:bifunctional ADP-heptose synthase (sugar kinase/adenylyltransferase)
MKKILVIGDSCEDIYHYGECNRLSPEAPVPVFKETEQVTKSGMSLNVVKNLMAFGFDVAHITNKEILTKHRFIDKKFKQHLLRVDRGEDNKIQKIDLKQIEQYTDIDAVVISDYNKGFLQTSDCEKICIFFESLKIPIFVDSKKKKLNCFFNCWLKINEKEYTATVSLPNNSNILITLGPRGAKYMDKIYPTDSVEVFDVCGAGDVFLSTFVNFYLRGKKIENSILLANKMAARSVTKFGTYVLTKADIKEIQ